MTNHCQPLLDELERQRRIEAQHLAALDYSAHATNALADCAAHHAREEQRHQQLYAAALDECAYALAESMRDKAQMHARFAVACSEANGGS